MNSSVPLVIKTGRADSSLVPAPFIIGPARSGTTLLRLMLDAHPQLSIPPETFFLPEILSGTVVSPGMRRVTAALRWLKGFSSLWLRVGSHHKKKPRMNRAGFFKTVTSHPNFPHFRLDKSHLDERLRQLEPFTVPDAVRAFYMLYAERFGKPRWGDKTPGYVSYMVPIYRMLPEARFLLLIRDGRDRAVSDRKLRHPSKNVESSARTWVEAIQLGRRQAEQVPWYMEVRYEDLLADTETTLRSVCRFLDLEWDAAVMSYHESARDRLGDMRNEFEAALHHKTSSPPDLSRIGCYRADMSAADQRRFVEIAGDMLVGLGYEVP